MVKIGLLALALTLAHAPSVEEAPKPGQPPPEAVRFTVAASGDFLIHTPVAARALALGGRGPAHTHARREGDKDRPSRLYEHLERPAGAAPLEPSLGEPGTRAQRR